MSAAGVSAAGVSATELPRLIRTRPLPGGEVVIEADEGERAALAQRCGVTRIDRLTARLALSEDDRAIIAHGTLDADLIQPCAISGEDFAVSVHEPLSLRFVPGQNVPGEFDAEIELEGDELDEIEYYGDAFDLGEAVAQSLALAIDLYAEGPNADAARKAAGIISDENLRGPLADALAALTRKT